VTVLGLCALIFQEAVLTTLGFKKLISKQLIETLSFVPLEAKRSEGLSGTEESFPPLLKAPL